MPTDIPHKTNQPIVSVGLAKITDIVVAKAERSYAEALGAQCHRVFRHAGIQYYFEGRELLSTLQNKRFRLLLIGFGFPDVDSMELIQEICQSRLVDYVVVIADKIDRSHIKALNTSRVDAIIDSHSESLTSIKSVLRMVSIGQVYVSPTLRPFLTDQHPAWALQGDLTEAEIRVLRVIGTGADNQEAAQVLGLSEATVHTHRRNIMHKFKVSTSAKLVHEAIRLGYVQIPILEPSPAGR